ncbi:hypothetical protein [Sorangium sp. So ce1389]|uniref:hypothetical protein n=1 Tax=Sorangium sp. So ce1389 TaxID=3133336 RepID=UPI003F5E90CD
MENKFHQRSAAEIAREAAEFINTPEGQRATAEASRELRASTERLKDRLKLDYRKLHEPITR